MPESICQWWKDDDECMWESPCGVAFQFNDGSPWENGMRYCFKCGKPMFPSVDRKIVALEELKDLGNEIKE